MAKNYFDRYVWLISTIARHEYIRFSDINDAWTRSSINEKHENLSQRTFFNHIDAILMVFGIEIKCDRSRGYYIANNEYIESDGMRQWLLESLSLNNLLNEAKDMKNRILFEKIPSSQRWLSVIVDAMRDEKVVEMTYQSFTRAEPHTFIAHPWCLKLFNKRWYMLARSEDYKEPRIYALDRIHELHTLEQKLKVPHNFNAAKFFAEYFGVIVTPGWKPENIELKVAATQVRYFDSLPLHASQTKIEENEKYSVYRYHIVPTLDFKQELLSRGPFVEVLSPKEFREEIMADVATMAANYGLR